MLLRRFCSVLLLCTLLTVSPVMAADAQTTYCFSAADFCGEDASLLGVCITETPEKSCAVRCGGRSILPGDVLTVDQLTAMEVSTASETDTLAALTYLPVFADGVGASRTLYISLRGTKDQPPAAADSESETYKNLALTDKLDCHDPEGGPLTFQLVTKPRRGEVVFHEDSTFTYTPNKEKVGKDSFVYVAVDAAGNASAEARVTIHIQKAISSGVFADMTGDPDEFEALFLRCNGLLSGEYVAGTLCFRPDQPVSYEEFLMMTMKLTGMEPEDTEEASSWFTPWQTAALRAGMSAEPASGFTKLDAAVLTAGLLDLPADPSVAVFTDAEANAAAECLNALEQAGLTSFSSEPDSTLTRRDAAVMLYELHRYCKTNSVSFPWA